MFGSRLVTVPATQICVRNVEKNPKKTFNQALWRFWLHLLLQSGIERASFASSLKSWNCTLWAYFGMLPTVQGTFTDASASSDETEQQIPHWPSWWAIRCHMLPLESLVLWFVWWMTDNEHVSLLLLMLSWETDADDWLMWGVFCA